MIKDNQKHLNRAHVIVDAALAAASYIAAYFIKFELLWGDRDPGGHLPMRTYFFAIYFLVPGIIALYSMVQLYTSKRTLRLWEEFIAIVKANIMAVLGLWIGVYVFWKEIHFSRAMVAYFFIINVVVTTFAHGMLRKFLRFMRSKGYNAKHILLVGYSRAAEGYISRILDNPQWGYKIAGVLDDFVPLDTSYHGIKVIGKIGQLQDYLEKHDYDEITITLPLTDYDRLEDLVAQCEKSGVHTKFIPDYSSLFPSNPYTENVQGLPVVNIRYVPLTNSVNKLCKRLVDIVGSLFLILIFGIPMIVFAIMIKRSSKGPVIFKQERVGLNGKPFQMYKFRTMEMQTEADEKKGWTTRNDPRVTKIGKVLRKYSLDETPQFFNILFGQMSLVGPRPERPQFVEKFKEQVPRYMVKHQVRPGLTGWAQINGLRGDTSIRKRIDYDIYYIENWSMAFDIKILLGTLRYGIFNKNAY
ncbi:MAG: undecaprenyl-phosphate glucose phosphotransferase [Butyrivibrio sp.]|nr:undecaprenyl-phosphate glucose phosphotransferase [Butyrivibrio sp.]